MKTSHGTIPPGLTLYLFEYSEARPLPDTVVCLTGECEAQPSEIFLGGDAEAVRFAKARGARRAVNGVTGRVVFKS